MCKAETPDQAEGLDRHNEASVDMRTSSIAIALSTVVASGLFLLRGQDLAETLAPEDLINHANCPLFDQGRGKFQNVLPADSAGERPDRASHPRATLTQNVMRQMAPAMASGSRTVSSKDLQNLGTIDTYIFGALQDAGVNPAEVVVHRVERDVASGL